MNSRVGTVIISILEGTWPFNAIFSSMGVTGKILFLLSLSTSVMGAGNLCKSQFIETSPNEKVRPFDEFVESTFFQFELRLDNASSAWSASAPYIRRHWGKQFDMTFHRFTDLLGDRTIFEAWAQDLVLTSIKRVPKDIRKVEMNIDQYRLILGHFVRLELLARAREHGFDVGKYGEKVELLPLQNSIPEIFANGRLFFDSPNLIISITKTEVQTYASKSEARLLLEENLKDTHGLERFGQDEKTYFKKHGVWGHIAQAMFLADNVPGFINDYKGYSRNSWEFLVLMENVLSSALHSPSNMEFYLSALFTEVY